MFRAFVFLTVLTLAAGPDASVLCQAWCGTQAATNECRHESPKQSPILTAGDCCVDVEAGVPATVARDLLTKMSSPNWAHALPGHSRESARRSTNGRHGRELGRAGAFGPPPLSTILRI